MSEAMPVLLFSIEQLSRETWYHTTTYHSGSIDFERKTVLGFAIRPKHETVEATDDPESFKNRVEEMCYEVRWFDEPVTRDTLPGEVARRGI